MLFVQSIVFSWLFILSVSSYVIQDRSHSEEDNREALSDSEAFRQLLEQVDPPALHAALHDFSPKKFKHGIFQEDQTAVEAIHRDDAPLATSILSLAKRQESGNSSSLTAVVTVTDASTTITATPINPSTVLPNPVEPSTRSTVPATPVPQPNSQSSSTAAPATPAPVQTTTVLVASTAAPATTSAPLGPGPVSVSSPVVLTPGAVLTSSNAAGMTLVTLTSGAVLTTTNAAGVTVVTTIDGGVVTLSGPAGSPHGGGSTTAAAPSRSASEGSAAPMSSFTSIVLQTTTLPNGVQSTITAITIIPASNSPVVTPSGTAGAVAGSTSTAAGGLQTGLAPRTRGLGWEAVGVLGGAVGFAMML
ncbi:hypothetical protein MMC26_006181 [Xylographa opegraphella]|nr:hypothetical protein [Xylographa opegraphella]